MEFRACLVNAFLLSNISANLHHTCMVPWHEQWCKYDVFYRCITTVCYFGQDCEMRSTISVKTVYRFLDVSRPESHSFVLHVYVHHAGDVCYT